MDKLIEILKRCEAATPGEWTDEGSSPYAGQVYTQYWPDKGRTLVIYGPSSEPNGKFISHARTDLPLVTKALQKAVEALQSVAGNLSLPQDTEEYWQNRPTIQEVAIDTGIAREALAEITAMLGEGK